MAHGSLSVPVVTDGPFLFLGIPKGLGLDLLVISALSVLLKKEMLVQSKESIKNKTSYKRLIA